MAESGYSTEANTSHEHVNVLFVHSTTHYPLPDTEVETLLRQLDQTRFVVLKIFMPLVVVFGVIGNILNISVLTRRWMRSSTNYYLTALAICDILYLLFATSLILDKYFASLDTDLAYKTYYFVIGVPLANTWSNTGVWLTLTFTVERYIGVCHPMKGKRWCTPQRAKYIIIAVAFTCAIVTFPHFLESRVELETINNQTIPKAVSTAIGNHTAYAIGYSWLNQTLFTFLPLCLLLIFNAMLVHAVTVASKQRQKMSGLQCTSQSDRQVRHQREQHKITVMLIVVVMVFLTCQLPQAIAHLYYQFKDAKGELTYALLLRLTIMGNVCNLLVMINSSINFVLYSSLSLKFRRTFNILFCRCLTNRKRPITFIFSDMFSNIDTRNNVTRTTKGTSSPFASSPMRHAHSYVSINVNVNVTPMPSPTPSLRGAYFVNKSSCVSSRNGCLAVNQMDKYV